MKTAFALGLVLLACAGCQPAVRPNLPTDGAAGTSAASNPMPAPSDATAAIAPAAPASVSELSGATTASPADASAVIEPVIGAQQAATALASGQVVFDRIRSRLGPQACSAGSNSDRWRQRYAGNRKGFANHLQEILPLLDFVSIEVERLGLPSEFVFIPLVESWYRPEAMGVNGPAGMWQMIGSTARNHGINIRHGYDGRLSPVESTRAALSYLKTLQGMFGGWQAVVMAYNAGEGRMARAFRQARNQDVSAARRMPHGLSNITYDYVAKLQALSCLVAEPGRHGLQLPDGAQFIPLAPVLMDEDVRSLEQFASRRGHDPGELRRLNPGYKGGRVVAGVPRLVLMPSGLPQSPVQAAPAVAVAMEATDTSIAPDAGPQATHKVGPGESLWSIARRYSLSAELLRRLNGLGQRAILQPGQTLKLAP